MIGYCNTMMHCGTDRTASRKAFRFILPAALGLLLAAQPALPQFRGIERRGVTVYFSQCDAKVAEAALEATVAALPVLEDALQMRFDERERVRIIIADSQREFDRLAGERVQPWVQGVALPDGRVVLKALSPKLMQTVAPHELAHVLLNRAAKAKDADPPRWLHEGLAKYASGDFSQGDREVLGQAVVEGRLLRLDQLESAFSGTREEQSLAYSQSYTFVRYLYELHRGGTIADLLYHLGLTHDMDRALLRTYGQTSEELQKGWLVEVEREYLRHGLPVSTELLVLLIMGGLFLIVHIVNRRRRRLIRTRMQEEERLRRIFGHGPEFSEGEEPEEPDEGYWE